MVNNNVKRIRIKKGYTQEELANILSISASYLSKIERGEKEPSLQLAVKMARKLDCLLDDLFF